MRACKDLSSSVIRRWFLLALSLLLGIASAGPARGSWITGTVTGSGGGALGGAWVCAYDLTWTWLWCDYTDSSGVYAIGGLSTGSYKVEFDGQGLGYISEWYQDKSDFEAADAVVVAADATTSGVDASLVMLGSITGTVTGAGGEALEGMLVCAYDLAWNWAGCEPTDSSGVYTIGSLSTGSYKLEFDGQGFGYFNEWYQHKPDFDTADAVAVTVGSTTSGIDVSFALPGSLRGKVTGAGGKLLDGVWVCAFDVCENWAGCGQSDASGVYTIGGLSTGRYKVEFDHEGSGYLIEWYLDKPDFDAAIAIAVTAGSTTAGIDASLALGGSIAGRVTGSGGKPLEGVRVFASNASGDGYGEGQTNASGAYTIGGLRTGRYKIEFDGQGSGHLGEWYRDKPDFDRAIAVAVAAGSKTTGINASLMWGGSIAGTVTDAWVNPVEGVLVCVSDVDYNWSRCEPITDGSGAYTVDGLPTGRYKLEFDARWTNYLSQWYRDKPDFEAANAIAVTAGSTVIGIDAFLALGGSITGIVTDSGGNPLRWVEVCAHALNDDPAGCGFTDESGAYTVGGLSEGSYKVWFGDSWPDYLGEWFGDKPDFGVADAVAVAVGSTTTGIDASLARSGLITGTVQDAEGNRLEGVGVCAYHLDHDQAQCESTDEFGIYTIGGLHTGAYKVEFDGGWTGHLKEWYPDKPDFDAAEAVAVTAESTTTGIDATLPLGGSITGTVTDSGGNPLKWVTVCAIDPDWNSERCENTDVSGIYIIVGLPTGSFKVEFRSQGSYLGEWYEDKPDFDAADAVAVAVGSTTPGIDATLALGGSISGTVTPGGSAAAEVEVLVFSKVGDSWVERGRGSPKCDGTYTVVGLPAGSCYVKFDPGYSGYQMEFYSGATAIEDALSVAVSAGQLTSGIDADLVRDITAPSNGTVTVTPGDKQLTLSWSKFADAGSGIAGYRAVFLKGSTPSSCNSGMRVPGYNGTSTTLVHTGLVNGTTYGYRICAIDGAGNRSSGATKSGRPVPETNPPTGTVKIRKDEDTVWTKRRAVTLDLSAEDASPPIKMCVSNMKSCTAWTSFSKKKSWTLTRGDEVKTVRVWFRDAWGNVTLDPYFDTIDLDSTAPTNVILTVTGGVGHNDLSWTVAIDGTGSGVVGYRVVFKTGSTAPSSCTSGTPVPGYEGTSTAVVHNPLVNGTTYAYRVCAIDAAGNLSSGATKTGTPSAP